MVAAVSVIVVVVLSLLITRVATVALTLTGLSRESARFQARSALSGVGFTTTEAESVVNHPVRRRIVMSLMLVGSAGIVTAVASLMLSMANADPSQRSGRLALVVAGLIAVWMVARSERVDRFMSRLIAKALSRATSLEAQDYAALLHLSDEHAVVEAEIQDGTWVAGRTLRELELRDEGIIVLGVTRRSGEYLGAPGFDTALEPGDVMVLYGHSSRLAELDCRPRGAEGDRLHAEAVGAHRRKSVRVEHP